MHPLAVFVTGSQKTHSLVFTLPQTERPIVPSSLSVWAKGQIFPNEHSPREKRPHISFLGCTGSKLDVGQGWAKAASVAKRLLFETHIGHLAFRYITLVRSSALLRHVVRHVR